LEPPPPTLPADVVETTSIRYRDAYKKITGADLPMDA
jgi:phosphoribosylaminoimidazole-succinocarboxamide synthase